MSIANFSGQSDSDRRFTVIHFKLLKMLGQGIRLTNLIVSEGYSIFIKSDDRKK